MGLTQVKTTGIADDAITSAKIADDAVVAAAIADDAVVTAAIADDAVTGANIADDTVAEANMANDAISLTELKAGTDGQIITWDASGNPVAVGPGTDGQVLTSTGAGSPPAFEAAPGGSWEKLSQVLNGGNVSDITFTSLDTTTYRAFKLMGGMRPVTDDVQLRLRFRVGSSDLTTSKYDWAYMVAYPDDGHLGAAANDQDYIRLFGDGGNTTREGWTFELLLLPHVDGHAGQIGNIVNWQGMRQDDGHLFRAINGSAYYDVDDQYVNGFKLYASSGNFVEHNYTLYGIKA